MKTIFESIMYEQIKLKEHFYGYFFGLDLESYFFPGVKLIISINQEQLDKSTNYYLIKNLIYHLIKTFKLLDRWDIYECHLLTHCWRGGLRGGVPGGGSWSRGDGPKCLKIRYVLFKWPPVKKYVVYSLRKKAGGLCTRRFVLLQLSCLWFTQVSALKISPAAKTPPSSKSSGKLAT